MGRTTWFDGEGMKKGEWTAEEDKKLVAYINESGLGDWRTLPTRAGLQRCGKSCRLRWLNYLRPGIKRGKFSPHEEDDIIKFHALLGNRWAAIAKRMPNRTDNDIKNHWNSCLKKRLVRKGIDPMTHGPLIMTEVTSSSTTSSSTPSPSSLSSSSSPFSSSSSSTTGSASLLNKLATEISSRKHGLEKIKTVIFSAPKQIIQEEEEKAVNIGGFMEIDDEKVSTTTTTTSFEVAFDNDDYSLTDPFGLDFYQSEQLDMFLL